MGSRRRRRGLAIGVAAFAVLAAGCGSGTDSTDESGSTDVTAASTTSVAADSTGDVVEVPPAEALGPDDLFPAGTDVAVGQIADMGAIRVTVGAIDAGSSGNVVVSMTVENTTEDQVFLPDTSIVCSGDGRGAIPDEPNDIEYLAPLDAGATVSGDIGFEVPDDCDGPLVQVRSPNEVAATEPVAQLVVPPDALPG